MIETTIPWDFLGLLLGILIVMRIVVLCLYGRQLRRRTRLTSPRKDYVNRPQSTHKVWE